MPMEASGMGRVLGLLSSLKLERYAAAFEASGYDDLPFLLSIADDRAELDALAIEVGLLPGHAHRLRVELGRMVGGG